MIRILTTLLFVMGITGCASTVPEPIRTAANPVSLTQVRQSPSAYVGTTVRWGGTITHVKNLTQVTEIEIVARSLSSEGRPLNTDSSDGRFIARVTGFLDPAVYAHGREVTVRGVIKSQHVLQIGEFEYQTVLVEGEFLHLWPVPPPVEQTVQPPWWWDPWYYPHHWPYYPPPYW